MTDTSLPSSSGVRLSLRHQLPGYSPIPLRSIVGALRGAAPAPMPWEAEPDAVGIACGSGTQALQVAIQVARRTVGSGGPIALPAYTCFEVGAAAIGADERIALYDLDPRTLSPDLVSLKGVIRGGARIVIVSHLYGLPVDWRSIAALAEEYGALVIEDAAQGHGALLGDRFAGTLGRIGVLSFGRGKGWSGMSGGLVVLRGFSEPPPPLRPASPISGWLTLAKAGVQWALGRPEVYWLPASLPGLSLGETRYHPPAVPSRMAPAALRLLARTRPAAAREVIARRSNAQRWRESLPPIAARGAIEAVPGASPGYLRFPLRLPRGLNGFRDVARARRLGVAGGYPRTLIDVPEIRAAIPVAGRHPGADTLVRELVTLPTHSLLAPRDIMGTCRMIREEYEPADQEAVA